MDELRCPITLEVMADPVMLSDGHTYERSAAEKWLATNSTSPLTGEALDSKTVLPNHALRRAIQAAASSSSSPHTTITSPLNVVLTAVQGQQTVLSLTLPAATAALPPPTKPLCLVCVLDRSGSMDLPSQAPKPGSSSASSEPGAMFTRMDLVKHSMRTAIELLRPEDCLVIVSFASVAKLELKCTRMDDRGKAAARAVVTVMYPSGGTNLWHGLALALDVTAQNSNVALVLQTDGEPSQDLLPPRGIVRCLQDKLKEQRGGGVTVHSCGYGYGDDLDSGLLRQIATLGSGSYAYIPDGSMVGTVFVHLLCNLLTVALTDVQVLVTGGGGGGSAATQVVKVGPMRAGQPREFVLPMKATSVVRVTSGEGVFAPSVVHVISTTTATSTSPSFAVARADFVRTLEHAIALAEQDKVPEALDCVRELGRPGGALATLRDGDARAAALLMDILPTSSPDAGQVDKALREWHRWGKHYLPSVLSAHSRQEKVNFKDASLEMYSTPALDELVARAEQVFGSLPPPTSSSSLSSSSLPPPSMTVMMNRSGGCFSGDTQVVLADGVSTAAVASLRKGMRLKHGGAVVCVVRYATKQQQQPLFRCHGLGITAYHPVRAAGSNTTWSFPKDGAVGGLSQAQQTTAEVYNLVLDTAHYVETVSGVQCVTLGHGITGDAVAEHPYFGTQRAVDDLRRRPGYAALGWVEYTRPRFVVDAATGLVCGVVEEV